MVKVSIILPIYNVAPYLEETFESLIHQSLKDIEIIAVNDGSTDHSEDIIRQYQQKDPRIVSLSQENKGQSAARNLALQHATGEYIYMMDSDDILAETDALEACYDYAEKNQAEFIFFDGDSFSKEGSGRTSWNTKRTNLVEEDKKYDGHHLLQLMLDTQKHNCVVWLLFIRKAFLDSIGLKFYEGIIHEDELFTTILTLSSQNIYCLKRNLVGHRIRSASTMGINYSKRNMNCYLTVADQLLKFSREPIIHKFLRYTLSRVFYTGHQIPLKEKPAIFWRALCSGYLKYIGLKSSLVFWLKRTVVILQLLVLTLSASAQQPVSNKVSPWLRQAVRHQQQIKQQQQISHRAADDEDLLTTVFVEMKETMSDETLEQYGCRKYAQVDDIAIVTIPLSQVDALTTHHSVLRIEANERAHTTLDTVPKIVDLLPVYHQTEQHQAFTGEGVVLGLMDVGIDLSHPTFFDDTALSHYRIKAFWDQLSTDTIGSPFPVGRDWTTESEILSQGCSIDGRNERHGTHTLGTAAGSGYDSPYRGVAYDSDICLVANAVTEDTIFIDKKDYYKYTTATDALGFKYIFDYAEKHSKPFVISFSEGYTPYFDNEESLFARFLKGLEGPGRILVVAAGNENREQTHAVKPRNVPAAGAFVRNYRKEAFYCIKADGPLTISFYGYRKDNGELVHELHFDGTADWTDDTVTDTLRIGEEYSAINITRYPSAFSDDTIYQLTLTTKENHDQIGFIAIAMEGTDCQAEILGSGYSALANHSIDTRWNAATGGSNLLAPSSFDAAICVGATSHRLQVDGAFDGSQHITNDEPGLVSYFSSRGPTISGHIKPDVLAPGFNIIASLSSYYLEEHPDDLSSDMIHFDVNGRTYVWGLYSGTSMATPIVAGTIALWLQANPSLTREDIIGVFQRTCRQPDPSLSYPNNDYGYGEIDSYKGLLDILGLTGIKELSHQEAPGVLATVRNGQLILTLPYPTAEPLDLRFYSTSGTMLYQATLPAAMQQYTLSLPQLSTGIYALQLTGGKLTGSQLVRVSSKD